MISGWYMASTSGIHKKYDDTIGQIETSGSIHRERCSRDIPWCLDNGVFTGKFDERKWLAQMENLLPYKDKCIFVAAPDVVGDSAGTLERFKKYRKAINYPVAYVSQDGIKDAPWDDFDCLFIGGSDEHKLGKEGGWILNEAKARGKWVHVGRVNSASRILKFWQADSWDGTHLGFMPSDVTKFHAAVLQVRAMKAQKGLF